MKSILKIPRRIKAIIITLIYKIFKKPSVVKKSTKCLTTLETIKYIKENKVSISRFGNGEIELIKGKSKNHQTYDINLSNRLKEVITNPIDKHISSIVHHIYNETKHDELTNSRKVKRKITFFWNRHLYDNKKTYRQLLENSKILGEACISRFYMDYKYKNKDTLNKYIKELKGLWNNKDVVFVEGTNTRLGINNDLFDNTKSIKRILCPSKNAFKNYDDIYSAVLNNVDNSSLIIMALGATASVLAYDLTKKNYQALDLGHIDIEYDWFKMNAKKKVNIVSKDIADQDIKDGFTNIIIEDSDYNDQVILTIK